MPCCCRLQDLKSQTSSIGYLDRRRVGAEAKAIISGYDATKKKSLLSRFRHASQLTPEVWTKHGFRTSYKYGYMNLMKDQVVKRV